MPRKQQPATTESEQEKGFRDFQKDTKGERTAPVKDTPTLEKVESPDDVWTYKSKYEYCILVPNPNGGTFRVEFNNGMYIVNASRAARHGITMAQMNKALQSRGSFGVDFVLALGPGYTPTERVKQFVEAAESGAIGRKIAMVAGTRTTGSSAGIGKHDDD